MPDKTRGDDAQDHVKAPVLEKDSAAARKKQDAPNYKTADADQSIDVDKLSSANDEGAN